MSALEDYQVDRLEVYARISKGAQLTNTNRTIGLIVTFVCSAILPLPKNGLAVPRTATPILYNPLFSR